MIVVRVRYDLSSRRIKILDEEVEPSFEDRDAYLLAVFDSGNDTEVEWIDFRNSTSGDA